MFRAIGTCQGQSDTVLNKLDGDANSGALRDGIIWNFGSLLILASTGLVLQVVIGAAYGAADLGVFNQVFAWYITASQLAVLGVHFSVLKHLSAGGLSQTELGCVCTAGLLLAALFGAVVAVALYFSAGAIGAMVDSSPVAHGVAIAAPGLFFFSLNKVAIAILNGQKRMRAFAIWQAMRPVLLLTGAVLLVVTDVAGIWLAGILTAAEIVLFVLLLPVIATILRASPWSSVWQWLRRHGRFGTRSAPSGLLSELNTRVDVLVLGVFTSDTVVGLYSFAAMLAEGVAQTLIVVRNNINPYLTPLLAAGKQGAQQLHTFVAKWKKISLQIALGAAVLGLVGFPVLVWVMQAPGFMDAYLYFAILLSGIVVASSFLSMAQTLMLAGHPAWHTAMSLVVVAVNVATNIVLASRFGALGAAIATAGTMAVSWYILRGFVQRVAKVRL